MKITTLILFLAIMQVSATTLAQKVSIKANNQPLSAIFEQISSQTGFDFAYTTKTLENAKPVTINVKNEDLSHVLQKIFDDQPLEFTIKDKFVTVTVKQTSFLDKLKSVFSTIDVKGQVVDETGKGLPGATVKVKGTDNVTTTDLKGNFTLKRINDNAVLVISFIGYLTKEVNANSDLSNIKLEISNSKLDEVKVIAYGTTTDRLSTGDVSSVSSKEIAEQPVSNPLLALEGRVPGLFITQSNGLPGSGVTVRIQGQNSISNGNDPLYVIDGVPFASQLLPSISSISGVSGTPGLSGNPLSYINPDDIESISVLKDADATSIYGSRAANGAIIITTKRGKVGETKVDINAQNGWGTVDHFLNLLNTPQYIAMRNEAIKNDGLEVQPTDYDINGFWGNRYTNWQKILMGGTAGYQNYNGTISGGSNNTQFLVGTTYHRETTVFPGDFTDVKGGLHFSINNSSVNQKFHLTLTGSYLVDNNQSPNNDLTSTAITLPPNAPKLFNSDGTLNWAPNTSGSSTWYNPLAYLYNKYSNKTQNLVTNAIIGYFISPGLEIKSSFGYTNLQSNEIAAIPLLSTAPENRPLALRTASYGNNNINSWIIEPQVSYKLLAGKGELNALVGTTIQQNNDNGQQLAAGGFNSDLLLQNISAGSIIISGGPSISSIYKYNAIFGRLNYNWQDRYIFNITARRDGSSRFGSDNQDHDFGAVGAAWIFSQEGFIKNNFSFLSFGKLRTSYGTTGNDQIGDYQFLSLYNPTSVGVAYQGVSGLSPSNLPNPHLQWEETKKFQVGLDLSFLRDRIVLNTSYFLNHSSNELLPYSLPVITGFSSILENFPATVQNKGWEFSLSSNNITGKRFSWSSNINLTISSNKLLDFSNLATSSSANSLVIGQPITLVKAYHLLPVDPTTGIFQFADSRGNAVPNPNFLTDRTVFINTSPKFFGGFRNSFKYNGLELSLLFQFVKQQGLNYFWGSSPGTPFTNQPITVLNRWQKPGDVTVVQRYNSDFSLNGPIYSSDAAYSDASYIRLKNLSLSWKFPAEWCKMSHLQNVRVYLQGQNLLTITKYQGLDPETRSSTTLPPLKVLSLGIQLGL